MQLFHLLFEELGKGTCSLSHHLSIKYTTFYHSQILTFYHFQILLFFCTFFFFLCPCSMAIKTLISVSGNSFAVFI